jgi:hypothetical protein
MQIYGYNPSEFVEVTLFILQDETNSLIYALL